ncbi:hypothetical protein PRIPAC_73160 [Pristionchus pacificus]|uniref:Signal recognition particle 14 kDa protein n=1 Tax=Pristionchus pacificus TaxID=54126 RepID=A0A2A6C8X4_PRIPA|nr:hypothetical protein PRIPAC_73160 [Pristionchus pacificus]|eukprot:PDM74665.1 hypothetical protein PRIPAC_42021 [Pristionchus pacificus]
MTVLDNDVFIKELGKFFFNSRTGGPKNVAVTMKRYDGRNKPKPDETAVVEPSVLFRAVCGNKKISTVVKAKEVNNFTIIYTSLMKESMDNLERRVVKKGEEEKKAPKKQQAKKPPAAKKPESAKGTPTALKK